MGLFRKKTSPAELAALSDEVSTMKARLDEADEVKSVLLAKLAAEQAEREDQETATEAQRLGERLQAPPSAGSLDDLRADVAEMAEQMSTLDARMTMLDERMTSISTELANQLTELSGELDVLLEQPATGGGVDTEQLQSIVNDEVRQRLTEAVDDIEASTTRLASEQARYQIQFRHDLAELAERLRRSPDR